MQTNAVSDTARVRVRLAELHGEVWSEAEMARAFEVRTIAAPYCGVRRRCDGVRGTLQFTTDPCFYFAWIANAALLRF